LGNAEAIMFDAKLERSGYFMRPVKMADTDAIAERLFSDIDVAKTLMHDVSTPSKARECAEGWCRFFAVDSKDEDHCEPGLGLWAICEPNANGSANELIGVRGLCDDPALPKNTAEGFAAVAKSHWGRGLSSESSKVMLRYAFEELGLDAVYTNIWPLLNPASEAVQRKVGYEYVGRTTVLESFGADRIVGVMELELRRLSQVSDEFKGQVFKEAGIKLGQLSAEDNLSIGAVRQRVADVLPNETERNAVFAHMEVGYKNPGWATYRLARETWAASR
jgi:RimJ/RimL family protein N-acetyltransferase